MAALRFFATDGGRGSAGFRGHSGDCVTRAISTATGLPYLEVYNALNQASDTARWVSRKPSSARDGVWKRTYHPYILNLGWNWTPTMSIGSGCKVHMRPGELPSDKGFLIVSLSLHMSCVLNGEVCYDTYDPCRGGNRCVFGYYWKG